MAEINRIASPMDLLDESVEEAPAKVSSRKKFLEKKQRIKSPFLIGSIDEVSRRISQLDDRLQKYAELVCESRASTSDDALVIAKSALSRERYQHRERDKKELYQFAGIYTLKSTLVPKLSPRAKNVSKITIAPKDQKAAAVKKEVPGKLLLVELHLFPGYDPKEPTPLPGGLQPLDILKKVVHASVHFSKKYRLSFEQLFFSELSKAILMDVFWYIFLEKFQPNSVPQQKLFHRTAHNYVSLLMSTSAPSVKDTFWKEYPKLMSQAVYSSFCASFPNSYSQFGEKFKDSLVYLVYGWMTGIRPPPRSWVTWDMLSLEPPSLKQREEMMNRKDNKKDFDYLDSLPSTNASQNDSTRSTSMSTIKSSAPSVLAGRNSHTQATSSTQAGFNKVSQKSASNSPSSKKSDCIGSPLDSCIISAVGYAQGSPEARGPTKNGGCTTRASKLLTPIQEMTSDTGDMELDIKLSQISDNQRRHTYHRANKQSHPIGPGCQFVHTVFNMAGKSPLVEHFLRMKGLGRDAGMLVWVNRVELENLTSTDGCTYKDVIAESSKNIVKLRTSFLERHRQNKRSSRAFISNQKATLKEHMHQQSSLLADEREVKRLSHLIIMEQRRSQDSVTAGADAAVEEALMAQH